MIFLKTIGRRAAASKLSHHIDFTHFRQVAGWAFDRGSGAPVTIEARHGEVCVGRAVANFARLDVAETHRGAKGSATSGFHLDLNLSGISDKRAEIRIVAVPRSGEPIAIGVVPVVTESGMLAACQAAGMCEASPLAPFPRPVMAAVINLWPEIEGGANATGWDDEIAERILFLWSMDEPHRLPFLADYMRFLHATWKHFQFVLKYFPKVNVFSAAGEKDAGGRATVIEELMSIAHHLYVLKSYDVPGHFAEFGCFKGFSSSVLSFACGVLGIPMHVFDSFAGLPESESAHYRKGEFRGDFDEVQRNVELFGTPEVVTYHQGYFRDTVRPDSFPQAISIWLDVDLASSSRDVMAIAHKIDPRGAVFSHECLPHIFSERGIDADAGSDSAFGPVIERFAEMGTPLAGRFMTGSTGAFWRRDGGVPILSNSTLLRLLNAI